MEIEFNTDVAMLQELERLRARVAELEAIEAQRRQTESELQEARTRLHKAEEVSHLGSWEMELATGGGAWSDEFYRICGLEPHSVPPTAEEGFKLIHPDDRQRASLAINEAIENGGYYSIEKRIVRPDGEVRVVQSIGEVLSDEEGRPVRLMGSFLDITERKAAEESLREYTEELEESNSELDAFAHTVAHDLKSPLSVVVGWSQLLEEKHDTMRQELMAEAVRIISETSIKMDKIIKELLLLASVRRRENIERTPLDMAAVVCEALMRHRDEIELQQAKVVAPVEWPVAVGYAPWIEEVWSNYISNALKYGGTPPQLEIGVDSTPTHVRYWLCDNGDGLTEAEQQQLFTEFSRVHTGTVAGSGLGLSIVRRIVERLGGDAGVESWPGHGSRFYFTLPIAE